MDRIVKAMERLRDAGNTLVVVEHDPAVMLAADRMIDIIPAPARRAAALSWMAAPKPCAAPIPDRRLPGGRKQVGFGCAAW